MRKDLLDRWSNVIVVLLWLLLPLLIDDASRIAADRREILMPPLLFLAGDPARRSGEEPGLRPEEEFELEDREPLLGLWELRGLRLSHEDEDGDGEAERVTDSLLRLSGMGLGGIGEGSCQR